MTTSQENTLRKHLLRALRIVVTVGLLAWVLSRVGVGQVLATLGRADFGLFGLALLVFQVGIISRAARWWVLLRASNIEASPGQILVLHYGSQLFNVSLPTGIGGDVMRTVEFKGSDSTATSAGIVLLDRILGFATLFAIGLVALVFGYRLLDPATTLVLAAVSVAGLVSAVVVLQGDIPRRLTGFLPQSLSLAGEGWLARLYGAVTGCSRSGLALALVISTLNSVLVIVTHYLLGLSVGIQLGIGLFFIITPIVSLSLLLPTIGGLGPREAGFKLLLGPLGVPGAVAVALGFAVYLSRFSGAIVGGLLYLVWSARR